MIAGGTDFYSPETGDNRDWQVVLMRCGSATHAFDGDQRCVVLRVLDVSGQRIVAQTPPNTRVTRGALPAGWYMLFVLDRRGVPSEAAMVLVRNR